MSSDNLITVVDAVMGTGKSTWLINEVNANPKKKYIILTPYLPEVKRFRDALTVPDIVALDEDESVSKTKRLKEAIYQGKTIITTHKLFTMLDTEGFDMIKSQRDYSLIIDETITLVEEKGISQDDFKMLEDKHYIETEPTNINGLSITRCTDNGLFYEGIHEKFLAAAHGEHVFRINKATVVFVMPPEKMQVFMDVKILTYLFEGSETNCWLQLHSLKFDHVELQRDNRGHKLLPHNLRYSGSTFKPLITIDDNKKLNAIGKKQSTEGQPLSHTWFKATGPTRKKNLDQLSNNTQNFFKNRMKVKGSDILWTCPKGEEDKTGKYKGKGEIRLKISQRCFDPARTNTWLAYTTRATNEYKDRHYLAFLLNVFPKVTITQFFNSHGITMNMDRIALSTLVQWVWRSAIRIEEEITIYLPSERMRELLTDWLDGTT